MANLLYKLREIGSTKELCFKVIGDYKRVEISEWISGECMSKNVFLIKAARGIWNNSIGMGYVPCESEYACVDFAETKKAERKRLKKQRTKAAMTGFDKLHIKYEKQRKAFAKPLYAEMNYALSA